MTFTEEERERISHRYNRYKARLNDIDVYFRDVYDYFTDDTKAHILRRFEELRAMSDDAFMKWIESGFILFFDVPSEYQLTETEMWNLSDEDSKRVHLETRYNAIRRRLEAIVEEPGLLPGREECPHVWEYFDWVNALSEKELKEAIDAESELFSTVMA